MTVTLTVQCGCGWIAGRDFAVDDGWDLSCDEPICSLCVSSEGPTNADE